jgi:hypothetical protein
VAALVGLPRNAVQLFEPIVAESEQHPNFRSLLLRRNPYTFDVLQDWARGFVDRDGKFVREFQTTFNSCFWELYVFAVLKKYGLTVDFTKTRPDFFIPPENFNIEATIASNPRDGAPEYTSWNSGLLPKDFNEFNRRSILRLANSLAVKHRKYLDSYAGLDHVRDRPFVIAITSFDQPFSFMAAQRAIEAVVLGRYVDEERYIRTGRPKGGLDGEDLRSVLKETGSPVDLGLFRSPAYRQISAVIFNGCATIGKVQAISADPSDRSEFTALRLDPHSDQPHVTQQPKSRYQESLVDGLRIYHNPFATHPLNPAIFRHPSVFQLYHDDADEIHVEQREGLLLFRSVITQLPRGTTSDTGE